MPPEFIVPVPSIPRFAFLTATSAAATPQLCRGRKGNQPLGSFGATRRGPQVVMAALQGDLSPNGSLCFQDSSHSLVAELAKFQKLHGPPPAHSTHHHLFGRWFNPQWVKPTESPQKTTRVWLNGFKNNGPSFLDIFGTLVFHMSQLKWGTLCRWNLEERSFGSRGRSSGRISLGICISA